MAGSLHAEESDYKTAFSYFYESYENFESVSNERAVDVLKCVWPTTARPDDRITTRQHHRITTAPY